MGGFDTQDQKSTTLPRVLGPVQAYCVVVGCVIGSGIFLVPASVAHAVPFIGGIALVWVVGELFSTAGALTLAELSAMMPRAGGPYVYLRAAYGPIPAFLFGWSEFTVNRTGSMATLAAAFARYFVQLVPPPPGVNGQVWQAGAAVLAIAIVTIVNHRPREDTGEDTGHALSTGVNREPGMPACTIDDVGMTPTDASDSWSLPILSAWPEHSLARAFREHSLARASPQHDRPPGPA